MARIAMVVTNACAPDPRVERHAKWLVEEGHEVNIYAWDREGIHLSKETRNNYTIHRKQIGSKKKLNSFTTWFRKKKFITNLKIEADLLILNDTDTGDVKFDGKRLLDIHDMAQTWPLMRSKSIIHRMASRKMTKQAKSIINEVDEIIVSSPGFQSWVESIGHDATVVMNRRDPVPTERTTQKVIGYFGRIRELESMRYLFEAADLAGFRVITAGDGLAVEKMLKIYPDIDYRGVFTEEMLPVLIKEISVMYAMYDPTRGNINQGAIPTKMLDASAYGRPSIVNKNTPMGDMCTSESLGVTASYGNVEDIAFAMEKAHQIEIVNVKGNDRLPFMSVIQKLLD